VARIKNVKNVFYIYDFANTVVILACNRPIWRYGPMGSTVARAYNRDMRAEPPVGSRAEPLVRGQGTKPPEAEALYKFLGVQ